MEKDKKTTAGEVLQTENEQQKAAAYNRYVKERTPKPNLPLNMGKAFLTGGVICSIGQALMNWYQAMGKEQEAAASYTTLTLVLLAVVLTGLNLYPKVTKFGGAGSLVPITGFANSVAAPAIEFQKEGQVFGIGCKIFTIAGPVILYGIFTSWILGLLYWAGTLFGLF